MSSKTRNYGAVVVTCRIVMIMTTAIDSTDAKKVANAIIGEKIHQLMWRQKRSQKALGELLGVDQGSISKRLRGKTLWSASEVVWRPVK